MIKRFIAILLVSLVTACTTVTYETADCTKLTVRKFQISGEELTVSGTLDGIGALDIGKKTEDSRAAAQAILDGLINAANP